MEFSFNNELAALVKMKKLVKYFLFLCSFYGSSYCLESSATIIVSPFGKIKGYDRVSFRGRSYKAFEGIPYAQAPIGQLRFQPPIPITKFAFRQLNTSELPVHCMQISNRNVFEGVEDCLFLNIYTAKAGKNAKNLPVIFAIHGGGFGKGSSFDINGQKLMDRPVILVTINYRLGPLGFLSTGNDRISGNMGLKDQSLALKWISQNIGYFGGDPNRITLYGCSAGGSSVHYHYLSPMSAGLFRNGISASGASVGGWSVNKNPLIVTKQLAAIANCSTRDTLEIKECLSRISPYDLFKAMHVILDQGHREIDFPIVLFSAVAERTRENYFINRSPEDILKSGDYQKVPWVAGVVSEEGLLSTAGLSESDDMLGYLDDNWNKLAPLMLHYNNSVNSEELDEISQKIKRHYIGDHKFSKEKPIFRNITKMVGDKLIAIGVEKSAYLQSLMDSRSVWFYYYSYADTVSNHKELGVSHGDDYNLIFTKHVKIEDTMPEDLAMIEKLLDFFYSFADEGKPNFGVNWPSLKVSTGNFQFLHIINARELRLEINNNFGDKEFWKTCQLY